MIAIKPVTINKKKLPTLFRLVKQIHKKLSCNYNCLKIQKGIKDDMIMNCNNMEVGCFHSDFMHDEDLGKCLVKGCKCKKFYK